MYFSAAKSISLLKIYNFTKITLLSFTVPQNLSLKKSPIPSLSYKLFPIILGIDFFKVITPLPLFNNISLFSIKGIELVKTIPS